MDDEPPRKKRQLIQSKFEREKKYKCAFCEEVFLNERRRAGHENRVHYQPALRKGSRRDPADGGKIPGILDAAAEENDTKLSPNGRPQRNKKSRPSSSLLTAELDRLDTFDDDLDAFSEFPAEILFEPPAFLDEKPEPEPEKEPSEEEPEIAQKRTLRSRNKPKPPEKTIVAPAKQVAKKTLVNVVKVQNDGGGSDTESLVSMTAESLELPESPPDSMPSSPQLPPTPPEYTGDDENDFSGQNPYTTVQDLLKSTLSNLAATNKSSPDFQKHMKAIEQIPEAEHTEPGAVFTSIQTMLTDSIGKLSADTRSVSSAASSDKPIPKPTKMENQCAICGLEFYKEQTLKGHTRIVHADYFEMLFPNETKTPVLVKKIEKVARTILPITSATKTVINPAQTVSSMWNLQADGTYKFAGNAQGAKSPNQGGTNQKRVQGRAQIIGSPADNANFTCPKCRKIYSSKGNLEQHYRAAHMNTGYECPVCKATFKWASGLTVHKRKHHPDLLIDRRNPQELYHGNGLESRSSPVNSPSTIPPAGILPSNGVASMYQSANPTSSQLQNYQGSLPRTK